MFFFCLTFSFKQAKKKLILIRVYVHVDQRAPSLSLYNSNKSILCCLFHKIGGVDFLKTPPQVMVSVRQFNCNLRVLRDIKALWQESDADRSAVWNNQQWAGLSSVCISFGSFAWCHRTLTVRCCYTTPAGITRLMSGGTVHPPTGRGLVCLLSIPTVSTLVIWWCDVRTWF